jgi:hypothetical protein
MIDFLLACILIIIAYMHIRFHLKTNNELEVHNLRKPTKDVFEKICDYRQPVQMFFGDDLLKIGDLFGKTIHIRNVDKEPSYVSMDTETADRVFEQDKQKRYISERNTKQGCTVDAFLRPPLCAFHQYDYLRGSEGAVTPLRYEIFYRHFLYVAEGSVQVRVATPNTSEVLNVIKDNDLFEFRSEANPWVSNVEFRTKELTLSKGEILYIPAFWWYSVKYTTTAARLYAFKYNTYASTCTVIQNLL